MAADETGRPMRRPTNRTAEEQRQEAELQAARLGLVIVSEERNVTGNLNRRFVTRCAICGHDTGAKTLHQLQQLKLSSCSECYRIAFSLQEAEVHAAKLGIMVVGEECSSQGLREFLTTCRRGHDAGRYTLSQLKRETRSRACRICRFEAAVALGASFGVLVTGESRSETGEFLYAASCATCQTSLGNQKWANLDNMKDERFYCSICREAEARMEAARQGIEIVGTTLISKTKRREMAYQTREMAYQTRYISCGHDAGVRTYYQLRQATKVRQCWCRSERRRLTHAVEVFSVLVASHDIPSDPAVKDVLVRTLARIAGKSDHPSLQDVITDVTRIGSSEGYGV